MILALVGKELQQHGPVFVGAAVLVAAILACMWFVGLTEDRVTLLGTAHQLAMFVLPLLVLFVNSRLVVHDHAHGTSEFLAALPIAPLTRTLVRFTLGLLVIEAVALLALVATALLASRREGVPLEWLVQLAAQIGVHLAAWHGVAFGVAHLGRFRWLAWWMFALSPVVVGAFGAAGSTIYWFEFLGDSADRTRLAPPWPALPAAVAWGLGGLLAAVALESWRGGVLVERWFRPPTADQRARLIGAGVAAMLVASVLAEQGPPDDEWATLPAVPAEVATVRVAASPGDPLHEVALRSAAALDGLGRELGVARWAPVVLLRSRPEPGRRVVRPASTDGNERSRVLLVDPAQPADELVRRVVGEALVHHLGGLAGWDADARWLVDAAAPWWLEADEDVLRRRAALGAGTAASAADDWFAVVGQLGPDVASGVAWAGLVALEQEAGREAVLDLLRTVLAPRRSHRWPGSVRLGWTTRGRWVERLTGVAHDRWVSAWDAQLTGPGLDVPDLPRLRLEVQEGAVVAAWDGPAPAGTTLEYAVVDALQQDWLPEDPTEVLALPDDVRELQLRVDVRARLVAQFVRHVEAVGGQVTTGWEAQR